MGQDYDKLASKSAKFFGGGSLVDPESPGKIVKRAKKFATGTAKLRSPGKRKRKSKKR